MEYEESLKNNDEEFKNSFQTEENEDNENEEGEEKEENVHNSEESEDSEHINIYKIENFELENVLNFFLKNEIFEKYKFCHKCRNLMWLENDKNYMYGKVWRCRTKVQPHDIKINVRENSLFEKINIPLPILYFLLIYCFTEKFSVEKTYIEITENNNLFEGKTCSKNSISKAYNLIRNKLKNKMHYEWKDHLMGDNISDDGFSVFEIDESKIIGNNDIIYWMFGIIDRISKEARIFCVLNNGTADNLMTIIKNNIATTNNININLEDDNNEIPLIYSDSFTAY